MSADERQSQRQAASVTSVVQAQQQSQATAPRADRGDSLAAGNRVSQSPVTSRREGRRPRRVRGASSSQNPQPSSTSGSESSGYSENAGHRSSGSTDDSEVSHASSGSLRDLRDELQYRDETISFLHAYIAFMAPGSSSVPPSPPSSGANEADARPAPGVVPRNDASESLLLPITVRRDAYAATASGTPQANPHLSRRPGG